MNDYKQLAEAVVQGWITRLNSSPLYREVYGDCECEEWEKCTHIKSPTHLDQGAAQENVDSIMLSELGQALEGDYGLARKTLSTIKQRFLQYCKSMNEQQPDVVIAKLHEIEIDEIAKALQVIANEKQ